MYRAVDLSCRGVEKQSFIWKISLAAPVTTLLHPASQDETGNQEEARMRQEECTCQEAKEDLGREEEQPLSARLPQPHTTVDRGTVQ